MNFFLSAPFYLRIYVEHSFCLFHRRPIYSPVYLFADEYTEKMSNRVSPKAVASSSQHARDVVRVQSRQPPCAATAPGQHPREDHEEAEGTDPFASQKGSHAGGGRKKKADHASKQSPMRTEGRGSPKRAVHSALLEGEKDVGERGGGRKNGVGRGGSEEVAKQNTGKKKSGSPESPTQQEQRTTDSAHQLQATIVHPDEVVVEKKVVDGAPQEGASIPDDKNSPPRIGASSEQGAACRSPPGEIDEAVLLAASSSTSSWRSRTILGIVLCVLSTAGGLRIAWLQGRTTSTSTAAKQVGGPAASSSRATNLQGVVSPSHIVGGPETVHSALSALERMGRRTADWVESGLFGVGVEQKQKTDNHWSSTAKFSNPEEAVEFDDPAIRFLSTGAGRTRRTLVEDPREGDRPPSPQQGGPPGVKQDSSGAGTVIRAGGRGRDVDANLLDVGENVGKRQILFSSQEMFSLTIVECCLWRRTEDAPTVVTALLPL